MVDLAEIDILDGRDRVGRVCEQACGQWIALDHANRIIGEYGSQSAATTAVLTARGTIIG